LVLDVISGPSNMKRPTTTPEHAHDIFGKGNIGHKLTDCDLDAIDVF